MVGEGEKGVSTYATVGTVCAAALLGGLVDLDVLDDQVGGVKTLGVGVGLGVLEEREDELGRLDGPAGLGDTELLAFGMYQYVCSYSQVDFQSPYASSQLADLPWAVRPVLPA